MITSIRNLKSKALLFAVLLGLAAGFAHEAKAEELSAEATLSDDTTEAGQPVELTVEIKGASSAQIPKEIDANGLSITFGRRSNNIQWINGVVTQSISCIYEVQGDHPGKFTIPAITVSANGKNLTTKPLELTVTAAVGGGAGGGNTAATGAEADTQYAFAELIVPKQTAYVGEAIPVEIRVYFDQRARFGQVEPPDVKCEGFTIEKFGQPRQEQTEKNGKNYILLSYKTAVTPVKSGKLTLGAAELQCVAQLPQRAAPRQPTGGIDDFFNDNLFNQMMAVTAPVPLTVKSNAVDFEVKPLPQAGQPRNFSGAVGQFSLTSEAAPLKLKVGDPITLKMKISGRGNFDRVNAPVMVPEQGWRSYPASGKFTADDDVGISGSKEFEMPVIPDEKKTKLPEVEFSYFDPVAEKYVTLEADRLPITVEGEAPQPAVAAQTAPGAGATAAAQPAKTTSDIQYIMTGPAQWGASFTPLFRLPIFWETQAAPALAFLAFVGIQIRRRKARDLLARQLAAWRREQNELMRLLQREDADPAEFYDAATRYIQISAARALNQNPESISPAEAAAARPLDAATSGALQSIFNAHGELRYAGVSATREKLPAPRRREVLETLRRYDNAGE